MMATNELMIISMLQIVLQKYGRLLLLQVISLHTSGSINGGKTGESVG